MVERVVKKGPGNLLRGVESVGGALRLTNQSMIFSPHAFNVQRRPLTIPLSDIVSAEGAKTLIFGLIPAFSNAIVIRMRNGDEHRFTVFGRDKWIAAISGLMEELGIRG